MSCLKRANSPVALLAVFLFLPGPAWAASTAKLGQLLSPYHILPFMGMILSIAVCPLVNNRWWEKNRLKVSIFWSLVFLLPFWFSFGASITLNEVIKVLVLDYLPFIILVFGLFTVSSGVYISGSLKGTPGVNALMLLCGTFLASLIGTTGASMILIRPVIRANRWREHQAHIIIFFIFLVSNIGGALTPLGDPPLFLGFLHGVPFFWTLNLIGPVVFNVLTLLGIFLLLDTFFYRQETAPPLQLRSRPLKLEGTVNFIYLGMIVGSVFLSGVLAKYPLFANPATGELYGIPLYQASGQSVVLPFVNMIRDGVILAAVFLSLRHTPGQVRRNNFFTWGPIKEVATLFFGLFITMIPVLAILNAQGSELGLSGPAQFFWATGVLSSFLDNSPTYLLFLSTAASLGTLSGVATTLGVVDSRVLIALSSGAVFMGANTYIGNAPNFMVRSIAEENKIAMPSFFGYLGWSLAILIPLFILDTLIFF